MKIGEDEIGFERGILRRELLLGLIYYQWNYITNLVERVKLWEKKLYLVWLTSLVAEYIANTWVLIF